MSAVPGSCRLWLHHLNIIVCCCSYYDYEWRLEQLRQIRRKQRAIAGKRSLADYGIVRRIHFIFDRATRKFKGDPSVWMAWLKFCRDSQSKRQVSKVITKALKLHPTAPYFWAYAAAWCASRPVRRASIQCTTLCCMPAPPGWRLYSGATLTAAAAAAEPAQGLRLQHTATGAARCVNRCPAVGL